MKLALFAAKGGAGTSTVAAQVARHLASQLGRRVAVIEPYARDIAILLDSKHDAQLELMPDQHRSEPLNLLNPVGEPYVFTLKNATDDAVADWAIREVLNDPQWDDVIIDMGTMASNGPRLIRYNRVSRGLVMNMCDRKYLVTHSDTIAVQRATDLYSDMQNPRLYPIDGLVHVGTYHTEAGSPVARHILAEAVPVPMAAAFPWDGISTAKQVTTSVESLLKSAAQTTEEGPSS